MVSPDAARNCSGVIWSFRDAVGLGVWARVPAWAWTLLGSGVARMTLMPSLMNPASTLWNRSEGSGPAGELSGDRWVGDVLVPFGVFFLPEDPGVEIGCFGIAYLILVVCV